MPGPEKRVITREERRAVMKLAASGASWMDIIRAAPISRRQVDVVLRPLGGVIRTEWLREQSPRRLSISERQEIWLGLMTGASLRSIAAQLGRSPSTVCREVGANGGRAAYRPHLAEKRACAQARRPKACKLAQHPELFARVRTDLEKLWSPQQIASRLKAEFGNDVSMTVSHETIYKAVYVQGRGELRRELARCLRSGRAKRRPKGRMQTRGIIPGMVMISERPAEVADRAVPGHWEGDLIIGSKGAIGTLVERTTRFAMLLYLPEARTADKVREALAAKVQTLPKALMRSITWDQGKEMSQHLSFSVDTGVAVYFCDPHSPWQRGSNENTNGLLRQYFPKGTDLTVHSEADLDAAADSLNGRPRQTLSWMTPSEKLAELLR
jgi:IS30 family transposase